MRLLPMLICSIGLFVNASQGSSATITVTTTESGVNADGLCSFAEAIENAHSGDVHSDCVAGTGMWDIVELAQGETYFQQPGDSYDVSGVIINGNGSTLSADGRWEGLSAYEPGASISNLTIRDADLGLLLLLDGGSVLLQGCGFEENDGGLLAFGFGSVLLEGCDFEDNIDGLHVINYYSEHVELEVRDSRFSGNSYGVGVEEASCTSQILITNSDFIQNGHGVWVGGSDCVPVGTPNVVVSECRFEGNEHGAIATNLPFDVKESEILNNGTGVRGSGVIEGCTITGNESGVIVGDWTRPGWWSPPEPTGFGVVRRSVISGNSVGVTVNPAEGESVRLASVTISGNETGVLICHDEFDSKIAGAGSVTVESSTISGNTYGLGHPDATCQGSASIRDSTIVENQVALAGLTIPGIGYDLRNSILSSTDRNCSFNFPRPWGWAESRGLNITNDDSCEFDHHTDMVVGEMMMSELGDYGGRTPVHMPLEGSPVIDMGDTDCPRRDQRGYKRPTDGNEDEVAVCDCGAVEYNSVPLPTPHDLDPPLAEID